LREDSEKEVEEVSAFFGDVFGFVVTRPSIQDAHRAIESIGLRNFFSYNARGKYVADIGCGYGRTALEMLENGAARVTCCDISEAQLSRTRDLIAQAGLLSKISLQKMSADNLTLPDSSYDIVVSLGVIHHLPNFERGLDELCRITKPNGILFLATLGKIGIIPTVRKVLRRITSKVPYRSVRALLREVPMSSAAKYIIADTLWSKYYHQFTLNELVRLLKERGFRLEKVGEIYTSKPRMYLWLQGEGYIHLMARKL
jgi:ubiquinone/menaquinone biosynthesis C-methylase UbiE